MMPGDRLQAFFNGLGTGAWAWFIRGVLALCLIAAAMTAHARLTFRGLCHPAAMEQAEIGRALAAGRGFVTRTVRPFDLQWLARGGRVVSLDRVPVTRVAPLYPAVLSVVLAPGATPPAAGRVHAPEWRIVAAGGVFTVLTAVFVFLLGGALFDWRTAGLAAAVYLVSDPVLRASTSGLAVPLLTCLSSLAALTAVLGLRRHDRGAPAWQWLPLVAAAGLVAGLAVLADYAMLIFAVVLAVFVGIEFRQSRAAAAPVFVVCALLAIGPWAVRNQRVIGTVCGTAPYAVLNDTVEYPERSLERAVAPDIHNVRAWRSVRAKLAAELGPRIGTGVAAMGGVGAALFILSLLHAFRGRGADTLKWSAAGGMVACTVAAALGGAAPDGLHAGLSLWPVLVVMGVAAMLAAADREDVFVPYWHGLVCTVLVLLAALPAVARLAGPVRSPYPPYYPPLPHYVGRLMLPGEAICSDIPEAVAWYGDRAAVLVPESIDGLQALRARWPDINAVYFTSVTGDRRFTSELVDGRWADWLPLLQRRYPAGFPFTHGMALPSGTRDQLFLTDRDRWHAPGEPGAGPR